MTSFRFSVCSAFFLVLLSARCALFYNIISCALCKMCKQLFLRTEIHGVHATTLLADNY